MIRRLLVGLAVLAHLTILTIVILWVSAPPLGACKVYVPLNTMVERANLIVTGYIDSIEENKYAVELPSGGKYDKADVKRTRQLHDARLIVTGILKGQPEFLATEVTSEADTIRSVHLLLDGMIKRTDGLMERISTDDHASVGAEGAFFLTPGEVKATYRKSDIASLADVDEIRKCMHTLATGYAGWTPGFAPDAQTSLVFCGSNYDTHVTTVVLDDGSVVMTGLYSGDFYLSGKHEFTSRSWESFLARVDAKGNRLWCRSLGCGQNVGITLAPGLANTFLLIGEVYGAESLWGEPLPFAGAPLRIIWCVSSDGRVLWRQNLVGATGPTNARGNRIGVEGLWVSRAADGYRIAGSFYGEMSCGRTRIVAKSDSDWFSGTLASDGALRKLHAICPPGYQRASVALWKRDGGVVMAGTSGSRWREEQPAGGKTNVFVSGFSADGRVSWGDTVGGQWDDWFTTAAISPQGMVVASMTLTGDKTSDFNYSDPVGQTKVVPGDQVMCMCAWDANGKRMWSKKCGSQFIEFGRDGNIYCAGSYSDELVYRSRSRSDLPPSAGAQDLFVECYDPKGERLWVRRDGGLSDEYALGFHLLSNNRAMLVGNFAGTTYLAGHVAKAQGWSSAFLLNIALPSKPD